MVVVACLLLIFSTIHMASDIKRLYSGLVHFRDTYPGGPPAWFANSNDPSFVFKNAVYGFQTVVGDGVAVGIFLISTAVGAVYTMGQPAVDSGDVYAQRTGQWITSFYSTTLVCNLVATGLLAYKLWTIDRNVHASRVGRSLAMPVLLIIIDAGALYSITLLTALIGFVAKSNSQYIVLDMVTPIISIAFYMVILRVGLAQRPRNESSTLAHFGGHPCLEAKLPAESGQCRAHSQAWHEDTSISLLGLERVLCVEEGLWAVYVGLLDNAHRALQGFVTPVLLTIEKKHAILKGGKEGVLGIALDVEKVIKKLQTGYLELRVKGIITVPISRISLLAGKLSRTYSSGQSLED
ncbi:hypothetical protein B0H13DRAFT_1890693 [Mycena leptocephala]|nr:hypothetical protein B0H13DRAFT_1890693 [Mycena leptocephala]